MPRYYCDYCDSFLTHDSVGRSRALLDECPLAARPKLTLR